MDYSKNRRSIILSVEVSLRQKLWVTNISSLPHDLWQSLSPTEYLRYFPSLAVDKNNCIHYSEIPPTGKPGQQGSPQSGIQCLCISMKTGAGVSCKCI